MKTTKASQGNSTFQTPDEVLASLGKSQPSEAGPVSLSTSLGSVLSEVARMYSAVKRVMPDKTIVFLAGLGAVCSKVPWKATFELDARLQSVICFLYGSCLEKGMSSTDAQAQVSATLSQYSWSLVDQVADEINPELAKMYARAAQNLLEKVYTEELKKNSGVDTTQLVTLQALLGAGNSPLEQTLTGAKAATDWVDAAKKVADHVVSAEGIMGFLGGAVKGAARGGLPGAVVGGLKGAAKGAVFDAASDEILGPDDGDKKKE